MYFSFVGILFFFLSNCVYAETVLNVNRADDPKEAYQLGLLKLALSYDKTENYTFKESEILLSESALKNRLLYDEIQVMWAGTQNEYEESFQPIRIPLFKGLLGHSIFIIREGNQYLFNSIDNFEDLKQLKAGQGRSWADTNILRNSGLNVVTTHKYKNLFYMLEGGRFDYFPRAIHEPWSEIKSHPDLPLVIEKEILLVYPLAAYFFVNKGNMPLKNKIQTGLRKAIDDGSFDSYFYKNKMIKEALVRADLKNRKVFKLDNPLMPINTPYNDKSLWFDIVNLTQ